jgi:uncharacterized protein with HEPN domain
MRDAAALVVRETFGRSKDELAEDVVLTLALRKLIEIVGEAANEMSEETKARFPDFPWQKVIAMRHKLIHHYYDVNLEVLWQTAKSDIPSILPQLEQMARQD